MTGQGVQSRMADKKKQAGQTEMNQPENVQTASTYSRAEILSGAAYFGVKPEVMAGALALTDKERLTKAEVNALIEEFKRKEVK